MNLILDTSILIEIERKNKIVIDRLNELKSLYPAPPRISFVSYFEYLYGLRAKSAKNKEKLKSFAELFNVIHTTNNTANFLVLLKEKYELPLADLLIAAQAIETNGLLVTKDKDFENIKEIEKIII